MGLRLVLSCDLIDGESDVFVVVLADSERDAVSELLGKSDPYASVPVDANDSAGYLENVCYHCLLVTADGIWPVQSNRHPSFTNPAY